MSCQFLIRVLLVGAIALQVGCQDLNIAFDLPDLSTIIETEHGEFQLEAYKAANNDRILQSDGTRKLSQLSWVSLGEPKLVRTKDRRNPSQEVVFDLKADRVSVQVSTLTAAHRKKLTETANKKHEVEVNDAQFVNVPLSHVDCRLEILDDDGRAFLLTGSAGNLHSFPLHVDFMAPKNSPERQMVESRLKNHTDELTVKCKFSANGKKVRSNALHISSQQVKNLGLVEKLFGPADHVSVTRLQLLELSSELYSALSVVEEYEMPQFQFSEAFVSGLLHETVLGAFSDVSVDEALASLSRYSIGFEQDLSVDRMKKDLGSLYKVHSEGSRRHIVLNQTAYDSLSAHDSSTSNGSGGVSYFDIKLGGGGNGLRESSRDNISNHESLSDQLTELNSDKESDVRWAIEGDKVIPKSIRVAKMWKGDFNRTLRFDRVLREVTEAAFSRTFRMEGSNVEQVNTAWERMSAQMQQLTGRSNSRLHEGALRSVLMQSSTLSAQPGDSEAGDPSGDHCQLDWILHRYLSRTSVKQSCLPMGHRSQLEQSYSGNGMSKTHPSSMLGKRNSSSPRVPILSSL